MARSLAIVLSVAVAGCSLSTRPIGTHDPAVDIVRALTEAQSKSQSEIVKALVEALSKVQTCEVIK